MNLNEYQQNAERFLKVLDRDRVLMNHLVAGIESEVVEELKQDLKKYIYDDGNYDVELIADDLGDILWYVSQIAAKIGKSLDDIGASNLAKLSKRYNIK